MSFRGRALWTLVVIAVVSIAVIGVLVRGTADRTPGASRRENGSPDVRVRVASARVGTIRSFRELPATVEPTRLAQLASPAEGPVLQLRVREGDRVTGGQLLVVIGRTRTTQARLASDREELRKVQDEFQRVERLVAKGALPGEMLDQARADLERAKAMVEAGEEAAADFQIRAPWTGVVSRVLVQEGNYVAPRMVLLEIFDPASLVVRLALPEVVSLEVQEGEAADVRFDALPEEEVAGRVARIYPELDRRLRTRTIEVEVEDPASLAPGMFARVRLTLGEATGATLVPAAAVVTTPDQERVLFVVAGDLAERRVVEVGIEDGEHIQVVSGLAAGERVVVAGHPQLEDGARVSIQPESAQVRSAPAALEGAADGRP
jgi:RND family efflux transporter MFP subunit